MVGYCGDGVNDVPALQAADAGLSVGASELGASVLTAPVASLSGSVMGAPLWSSMSTTAAALHDYQPCTDAECHCCVLHMNKPCL